MTPNGRFAIPVVIDRRDYRAVRTHLKNELRAMSSLFTKHSCIDFLMARIRKSGRNRVLRIEQSKGSRNLTILNYQLRRRAVPNFEGSNAPISYLNFKRSDKCRTRRAGYEYKKIVLFHFGHLVFQ